MEAWLRPSVQGLSPPSHSLYTPTSKLFASNNAECQCKFTISHIFIWSSFSQMLTHQIFEGTRKVVCIFWTSVSFWFYTVSLCSFKKPLWLFSPGQFEPASSVLRAARTLFLVAAFGSRQDAIVSEMRNGDLMNKGREKRGRD